MSGMGRWQLQRRSGAPASAETQPAGSEAGSSLRRVSSLRSIPERDGPGPPNTRPKAMKVAPRISLTEEERTTLNVWLRLPTSARLALRAKIILLAADGRTNQEIARQLRTTPRTVSLWRRRFLEGRLAGIEKEARSKRKSKVDEAAVRLILRKRRNDLPTSHAGQSGRWPRNWGFHRLRCIACGKPTVWILVKSNRSVAFLYGDGRGPRQRRSWCRKFRHKSTCARDS